MMASSALPVREFRRVMFNVAQQLTQQESDTLVWMHSVPVQFVGKPPLTVLAQMESQGHFSASKPDRFTEVLKDINRMDLVKQVTKSTKRKKNRVDSQSDADEYLNITLAANLEVTLLQSRILLEQVERLGGVVSDANERRIGEIVGEAKKTAEKLRRTLEHASGLCRSTNSTLYVSPSQEVGTLSDPPSASSNGGSAPTPTPSKPQVPIGTSSPLTSKLTKPVQQSINTDGIYEEPSRTQKLADKDRDQRPASHGHYYSAVQGGCSPAQLVTGSRPPTSPKPRPKRRATMAGTHTHSQPATTSKPQKPSMIPSPSVLRRGSLPPEQPHHNTDSSDYTGTYSGDDSGFAEATTFLKRPLTKRETTVPPDPPPRKASYYKSLTRPEDVKYYKTLQREAVDDVMYETCDTYETMASYKIPKEHIIPEEPQPPIPNPEEPIYMNLQSTRKL